MMLLLGNTLRKELYLGTSPAFWILLLIGALLAGISFYYYLHEPLSRAKQRTLSLLRWGALMVIVWMLCGWSLTRFNLQLPELWIVVDESASMSVTDEVRGKSRVQAAWQRITERSFHAELADRFELRYFSIGDGVQELTQDTEALRKRSLGEAAISRLGDDLQQILATNAERQVSAVWLFSDGRVTAGRALSSVTREIPVYATPLGSALRSLDLELAEARSSAPAIPGDLVDVTAMISTTVPLATPVQVKLVDEQGVVLKETALTFTDPLRQKATLEAVAKESGTHRWRLVVVGPPDEQDLNNNAHELTLFVREDPLNVLLVAYEPTYEFRFLKHLLERTSLQNREQPLLKLTTVLQQGDPRYATQDRSAIPLPPTAQEQLSQFDVVILLDADPGDLGRVFMERVAQQIDTKGLGLIVGSGPHFLPQALTATPLGRLMPLNLESKSLTSAVGHWTVARTPFGATERFLQLPEGTWESFPPVHFLSVATEFSPVAEVLLNARSQTGTQSPLLISQRVGSGSILVCLNDEFFRLSSVGGDDRAHEWFWLQSIRRQARGRLSSDPNFFQVSAEPTTIRLGEQTEISAQLGSKLTEMADGRVEVRLSEVNGNGDQDRTLALVPDATNPQQWHNSLDRLGVGNWRIRLARPDPDRKITSEALVRVLPPPDELTRVDPDLAALAAMTEATQGELLLNSEPNDWLASLPRPQNLFREPLEDEPLWNHPLAILLLLSLLGAEWLLRRLWSLP